MARIYIYIVCVGESCMHETTRLSLSLRLKEEGRVLSFSSLSPAARRGRIWAARYRLACQRKKEEAYACFSFQFNKLRCVDENVFKRGRSGAIVIYHAFKLLKTRASGFAGFFAGWWGEPEKLDVCQIPWNQRGGGGNWHKLALKITKCKGSP